MARSRNLKPGFFTNELLGGCTPLARLLFAGLWCHADREGRLEYRPRRLSASILPFDRQMSVIRLLEQLRAAGFITAYSNKNFYYLQINNFKKHQNPHVNESPSTIPAPEDSGSTPADSLLLIPDSLLPHPAVPVLSVPPQLAAASPRPVDKSKTRKTNGDKNPSSPKLTTCAYCKAEAVGKTNGFAYCRAHADLALDGVKPSDVAIGDDEHTATPQELDNDIPF